MPETIKWIFFTQVLTGPSVSAAGSIVNTDAYDKFEVELANKHDYQ